MGSRIPEEPASFIYRDLKAEPEAQNIYA